MARGISSRARFTAFAALSFAAASVLWAAPGASANISGCPGGYNGHCYGITGFGGHWGQAPVWLNAVGTDLTANCLEIGNPSNDFVNYEMWMDTGDNVAGSNWWVEEGLKDGKLYVAPGQPSGFMWFWEDHRPVDGAGANGHYISGGTWGTTNVSFYWQGNGNWNVYRGGSLIGESTHNADWAGGAQTGTEITSGSVAMSAESDNFQYADPSWHWHGVAPAGPSFTDAIGLNGISTNGSITGSFTEIWSARSCVQGPARPAVAATVGGTPLPAAQAPAALKSIGSMVSQQMKEQSPQSAKYIATTRSQTDRLLNEKTTGDSDVYLIQMQGHFTAADVPPGRQAPTGDTLIVTVSAATGKVTDWSIRNSGPDISSLGKAARL